MYWSILIAIGWWIYNRIHERSEKKYFLNVTVPQQLIQLVRQAHAGESFSTEGNISVGADMREKLCYPLTPEQVELIKATSHYQRKEFSYRLAGYKFTGHELSGTVLATIHFQDDTRNINLDYRDVPIFIQCGGKVRPGYGFQVCAVEHLQEVQDG